jgi:hypothetical protein
MSTNVLIVERPGEFRDGFVRALRDRGASTQVRDDAMETLASLGELSPSVVLVAEYPGAPGAGSLCRILRRRFGSATVYRLGDPALHDVIESVSPVLPRSLGAELLARALLEPAPGADAPQAFNVPSRAWEAAVGQLELGPLLVAIAERWLTGRLVLSSGSAEREIGFVRGLPCCARSSVFGERLGAVVVRQGSLSQPLADNASDLARVQGLRLGEALLQLGAWQGHDVFHALCAQLLDVVVAACNGQPCHARFVMDPQLADQGVLMRLHPMTALLSASQRMVPADLAGMLDQLGDAAISARGTARTIDAWLSDLGIEPVGKLLAGPSSVRALRERLTALLPAANGGDTLGPDTLVLALLRAGALKMEGRMSLPPPELRASLSSLPPPSMAAALHRCARLRFDDWPVAALSAAHGERDRALDDYLHTARSAPLARALALGGPAVEAQASHAALLAHYVRLPITQPQRFFGTQPGASAHQQMLAAYGLRKQLDELVHDPGDVFARSKLAELRVHVDRALAQLPVNDEPLEVPGLLASAPRPSVSLRPGKPAPPPAPPPPARTASLPPPAPPRPAAQSLAAFPEAEQLVLHGKWAELRELLATQQSDPTHLPPVLALVYAIALKEDTRPDGAASSGQKRVDADALGIRAMSALLGVPEDSAAALVLAKRTLRRRPIEWNQRAPARISFLLVLIALAIGAGVGLLLNPTVVHLPWK